MLKAKEIESPFDDETIAGLKAGDTVSVTGVIYTARDAAHKRMAQALEEGGKLPFEINGQTIYYMGPSPAPEGKVIGSAGPTTSSRMDVFTPALLEKGLKAIIGKGGRSAEVKRAIKEHKAVYFVTYGGAAALLAQTIKKAEVIAYPELAAEAVMRLEVEGFPAIVANDIYGGDFFATARDKYRQPEA